ncbi:hypothetical protein OHA79_31535 [Streptomyces sp. NBC_00841]|uniref:hypothetical protein n=1 Tax=unclassified Streptomyces TaxID=2593676 RepID=UPI00225B056F|nr:MULTISPECIES: hypothetical protein [unclassified Streptomyces]MCX4532533.1 hypothetical protein [Streptomyces sp. NBC_01669]WSA01984.1 hypothetical protein OHA79_31535 [Streptomyces sp. NBC_00841]
MGVARLMATATCTAFRGVLEGSGERVGQGLLWERVGFWARLSRELTGALVASRWDEDCLDVLAAGVDERGEALPSKGWMALRRLNWPQGVTPPAGVYVSDRVRRGAEEYAARTLRLAAYRRSIVTAVLATWPADPCRRTEAEWAALRKLLPAGWRVPKSVTVSAKSVRTWPSTGACPPDCAYWRGRRRSHRRCSLRRWTASRSPW